ncbi:hypothetical protein, partial [Chitinophaga sp.]|uniref:hypothetical protein n=1 Tax=Chitinophaga sp. TaxID=1869181 RepID=UPI002BC94F97
MFKMNLSDNILNLGLKLSMEFGKNWLLPVSERLSKLNPELTQKQLTDCNEICKRVNESAHRVVYNNPVKNGAGIQFIDFGSFKDNILRQYHWVS